MNKYHVYPRVWVQILVIGGMINITVLASLPNAGAVPPVIKNFMPQLMFDSLDYLLSNHHQTIIRIAVWSWITHVFEAVCSFFVAKSKNIHPEYISKWFLSVFLFGIFSFCHLLSYDPKKIPVRRKER